MNSVVQIPVPLPHIGSVNTWLLPGDPLTLVDTGPREDEALSVLEAGLAEAGVRLEDLELVLVTHHHLDHAGLAATLARSGAKVAALDRAADYGAHYEERTETDRDFSIALLRHHHVPEQVIEDTEPFWEYIRTGAESYRTDVRLSDGDRIRAGGRDLTVIARPGHSTTDTIFVDDEDGVAFVGDHLLARISSNTEIYPVAEPTGTRPRARVEYLESLRQTAAMPLRRLLTGHGEQVTEHAELVRDRIAEHHERCRRIVSVLEAGPSNAYEITKSLWSPRTVTEQPLLVVWEVLGHLDLLIDAGIVREEISDDGSTYGVASFALATTTPTHTP